MGIRTLLRRIEQAEKALKGRAIFSSDCICFPETEPPFFCFPSEEEAAAKVKVSLAWQSLQATYFSDLCFAVASGNRTDSPATVELAV